VAAVLTGGCACGAVRYELTEPLVSASYCHCTRCQRRTGTAASANGRATPGSFRITGGEAHIGTWAPAGGAAKSFCSLCGSALFSRMEGDPPTIGVRLGTVDGDPGIAPQWHQYVAYAASWEEIPNDGLPRYAEGRTS